MLADARRRSLADEPTRSEEADAKHIFHELKEKVLRDEVLEQAASASTAASSTRSARSGSRSACCRASTARRLHARRDAGAGHQHARHRRRRAEDRARQRRVLQALHAALQLPAVLGRRSRSFMRGPGRREIGHGALAERALAPVLPDRRQVPLHDPHRLATSSSRTARRRWRRSAAARWR